MTKHDSQGAPGGNRVYALRRRDVTHERLDGEVIAVNLLTGRYYSMSGAAADTFTAITSTGTQESALFLLEQAYDLPQDATHQIQQFLSRCIEAELIEVRESTGGAAPKPASPLPDDHIRSAWQQPQLEEYEDLQDLILVDPVHDTSALGWPNVDDDDAQIETR
jgi:hypothetical protein